MCKSFFGLFSFLACDCMQPWQKCWHSGLSIFMFTDFLLLRLHLHAIFHIVTTMSPYCYVVFMTYHRCLVLKREAEHRVGIGLAYVHVKEIAPWSARARQQEGAEMRKKFASSSARVFGKLVEKSFEQNPRQKYQFNTAVRVVCVAEASGCQATMPPALEGEEVRGRDEWFFHGKGPTVTV